VSLGVRCRVVGLQQRSEREVVDGFAAVTEAGDGDAES
jgi:hypothetical protein